MPWKDREGTTAVQLAPVLRHGSDHGGVGARPQLHLYDARGVRAATCRWIASSPASGRNGAFSAAPNFAFEHAAVRGVPRDDEPPLDLSNVKGILNGSEPVAGVDAGILRSICASAV